MSTDWAEVEAYYDELKENSTSPIVAPSWDELTEITRKVYRLLHRHDVIERETAESAARKLRRIVLDALGEPWRGWGMITPKQRELWLDKWAQVNRDLAPGQPLSLLGVRVNGDEWRIHLGRGVGTPASATNLLDGKDARITELSRDLVSERDQNRALGRELADIRQALSLDTWCGHGTVLSKITRLEKLTEKHSDPDNVTYWARRVAGMWESSPDSRDAIAGTWGPLAWTLDHLMESVNGDAVYEEPPTSDSYAEDQGADTSDEAAKRWAQRANQCACGDLSQPGGHSAGICIPAIKGLGEGMMPDHDPVNHPRHYTGHPSGVECITVTEHMSFCVGNAVKYLWRADDKGNPLEDLRKAAWYINREIARREQPPAKEF